MKFGPHVAATLLGLAALGAAHARLIQAAETNDAWRRPAKSPADAQAAFRVLDGFRLELLAAEPLLADPVVLQYDEHGRAWVAEMGDYPYSDKSLDRPFEDNPSLPLGRIRILDDDDGDGRFDRSTLFAEDLSWPTGLAFWKGGVFAACTPDILYLKDTDGDGRADVRTVVYAGFRKFNVQAVINNLQWGLDHRIYGAGASNGGAIVPGPSLPAAPPVRISRNDFRFSPVSHTFEAIAGGARFGNSFDDWGNRFLCNIRNPVQQVVIENQYLARNPAFLIPSGLDDSADAGLVEVYRASAPEPWRVISSQRHAADPNSTVPASEKAAAGYVTSASGVTIYRGAAYPEEYLGDAFVGEPSGNLVIRYELQPQGPAFKALHRHGETDFIASTDNWFRPVNFVNAPDGTLHVIDMYRETIEHPWSIPDDIKAQLDLRSGSDRGRLYRLLPPKYREGFVPPSKPRLGSASTLELVQTLENPNTWWRETAHRLLYERQDPSAVQPLRQFLTISNVPLARLHALWSLEGLGELTNADLLTALSDPSAGVRVHGIRLAEQRLAASPGLQAAILKTAADDDSRVRFQAALALGALPAPSARGALANIARRDAADHWIRAAVLSSLSGSAADFLAELMPRPSTAATPGDEALLRQLAVMSGAQGKVEGARRALTLAASLENVSHQNDLILSLGIGLKRARLSLGGLAPPGSPEERLVDCFFADARRLALDPAAPLDQRQAALQRLALNQFDDVRPVLLQLIDAKSPQEIQLKAVETLSGFSDPQVTSLLLDQYPRLTAPVRRQIVDSLLARTDRIEPLLHAVASGRVSATLIPATRRPILLRSSDPKVQALATKLFAGEVAGPRAPVIAAYQSVLQLTPHGDNGAAIFKRECANCHRLGTAGAEIGPNLSTVRTRSPRELLVPILDPNREVSPQFLEFLVADNDGRVFTGVIAAEAAASLTLRSPAKAEQIILRSDIAQIQDTGKSLMPEGLEQKITPQEMADLLEFLLKSPLN